MKTSTLLVIWAINTVIAVGAMFFLGYVSFHFIAKFW
jgi:hypothetical protein